MHIKTIRDNTPNQNFLYDVICEGNKELYRYIADGAGFKIMCPHCGSWAYASQAQCNGEDSMTCKHPECGKEFTADLKGMIAECQAADVEKAAETKDMETFG